MAFGVLFMQAGLSEDIVQKISDEKDDPVWMREFRMKSLQIYRQMQIPDWGTADRRAGLHDRQRICG